MKERGTNEPITADDYLRVMAFVSVCNAKLLVAATVIPDDDEARAALASLRLELDRASEVLAARLPTDANGKWRELEAATNQK